MSKLFGRIVRVKAQQMAQPVKGSFAASNPQFFEAIESGITITDLLIEFDITKNLASEPNKTVLKIHNLSPDERAFFSRKPTKITVELGYGDSPRLVAAGDLIFASTKRDGGTDNITTITMGDGIRAGSFARMSKLYKPPTTYLRVLQDMAKSMNAQLPKALLEASELKQTISQGYTVHGFTRDTMTDVLDRFGYGWSFQNGVLQVLRDEDTHEGERLLISDGTNGFPNTGLLDSPEVTAPEAPSSGGKGKPSEIKFVCNAYPEINPGRQIQLQSELLNATAKVIDVKHSGDNKKGKFQTAVTARAL